MRRIISARNRRITRSTFHDSFRIPCRPGSPRSFSSFRRRRTLNLSSPASGRCSRCCTALLTDALHGNDLPRSLRNFMQMLTAPPTPDPSIGDHLVAMTHESGESTGPVRHRKSGCPYLAPAKYSLAAARAICNGDKKSRDTPLPPCLSASLRSDMINPRYRARTREKERSSTLPW